jgi:hypothetical protein
MGKTPTASSDPTGGASKAKNFKPTSTTASLGSKSFGNTSKLAAYFKFGAKKVKGTWRFNLLSLTVKVGSKVQAENFRINVKSGSDKVVTKATFKDIVNDLRPSRRVRMSVSVAGKTFINVVPNYSVRRKYWNHQLVVDHEAFHRKDWIEFYRKELIRAEREVWGYTLPGNAAKDQREALQKADKILTSYMINAYKRAVNAYAPAQETRAYKAGAAHYQKLVDQILARAKQEKW